MQLNEQPWNNKPLNLPFGQLQSFKNRFYPNFKFARSVLGDNNKLYRCIGLHLLRCLPHLRSLINVADLNYFRNDLKLSYPEINLNTCKQQLIGQLVRLKQQASPHSYQDCLINFYSQHAVVDVLLILLVRSLIALSSESTVQDRKVLLNYYLPHNHNVLKLVKPALGFTLHIFRQNQDYSAADINILQDEGQFKILFIQSNGIDSLSSIQHFSKLRLVRQAKPKLYLQADFISSQQIDRIKRNFNLVDDRNFDFFKQQQFKPMKSRIKSKDVWAVPQPVRLSLSEQLKQTVCNQEADTTPKLIRKNNLTPVLQTNQRIRRHKTNIHIKPLDLTVVKNKQPFPKIIVFSKDKTQRDLSVPIVQKRQASLSSQVKQRRDCRYCGIKFYNSLAQYCSRRCQLNMIKNLQKQFQNSYSQQGKQRVAAIIDFHRQKLYRV